MSHIIATLKAHATDNLPEVEVCVRELPEQGRFQVFINGGYCRGGNSSMSAFTLREALELAAEELRAVLEGE